MAQKIIKDSGLNIFVKQTPCVQATVVNDFIVSGGKRGLAGINARLGEDGLYYTSVDTAALVRFDAISGAFTDGQAVYWTGTAPTATVGTNVLIGYADRAKVAAAGPLHVQLVPGVLAA